MLPLDLPFKTETPKAVPFHMFFLSSAIDNNVNIGIPFKLRSRIFSKLTLRVYFVPWTTLKCIISFKLHNKLMSWIPLLLYFCNGKEAQRGGTLHLISHSCQRKTSKWTQRFSTQELLFLTMGLHNHTQLGVLLLMFISSLSSLWPAVLVQLLKNSILKCSLVYIRVIKKKMLPRNPRNTRERKQHRDREEAIKDRISGNIRE